jgi:PAS domain S-box-containing protein
VSRANADLVVRAGENRLLSTLAACLTAYVVAGGLLGFIGWAFDVRRLTDWVDNGISIQPNACIAVMASGAALGLLRIGRRRAAAAAGMLVSLIGASTLLQHALEVDLGVDTLLMFERSWGRVGVISPGRMGPPGATSWTLVGMALILAAQPKTSELRRLVAPLGMATASISLLALVGYLYGSSTLYSLPRTTVIALQTASFIFAVSLGLMLSVPEFGPMRLLSDSTVGGVLARRLLPVVFVVPVCVGFLCLLGERFELYDSAFGSAARTLLEILLFLLLVWWAGTALARHERKRREADRDSLASRQRVVETLESITDAFVTLDSDWCFTYANAEAERLLAKKRHDLIGRGIWELFPELVGGVTHAALYRAAAERSSVGFEEYHASLGRWIAYKAHATPDGLLAVYFEDVTQRKQGEDALSASRAELEAELRDSQILQSISTELVLEDDSRRFYATILDAAIHIMRAGFGSLQTFHPEHGRAGELELLVHRGFSEEAARFWRRVGVESKSSSGAALRSGKRVLVPDIELAEFLAGTEDLAKYESLGIRATQSTPLVSRNGKLLGMITTHWQSRHEPPDRALRLLDILARQGADWMERKRSAETIAALNARLRADLEAVTRMHELSLARTGDFSALLHELVVAAIAITKSDMGTIQLIEGNTLKIASQQGFDGASPEFLEVVAIDFGSAGTNLLRRERVVIEDVTDSPLVSGTEAVETVLATGVRAIQSTPLLSRSGEILGVLSTHFRSPHRPSERTLRMLDLLARQASDLIEQRQAERRRDELLEKERSARADAERAARLKDEFLATLSHELRTPLNAVIGWAQILKKDISNEERVRAAVEVIERNGRQQARLITDLLDVSRIVSGNMRLDFQAVDLPAVVEAAIDSVLPVAANKGVSIQKAMEPIAEPLSGDPARLQQIVWNLLSNAVKFTPSGGRISVVLERVDANVEILVTDSGEGIEGAFLPHVFERFRQGDASASRHHGGLGLGLAIVKQLTELHGGSVRASSEGRGKGATFAIALPLMPRGTAHERLAPEMATSVAATAAAKSPVAPLSGLRVLVVDDEPDALTMVRHLLESNEADVGTASSSAAALDLLGKERFDLIVSDIGMPGGDGYALVSELRMRGIRTPALALTAFARAEDRDRAMESGYQAHIAKPIDAEELLAAVARWGRREIPLEHPRNIPHDPRAH